MRKSFGIGFGAAILGVALLTLAIGANPTKREELQIGGGYGDTGTDMEADGDIFTDGDLTVDGTITGTVSASSIASDTDVTIDLDDDNDGSNSLIVRDGADATVLSVNETADATFSATGTPTLTIKSTDASDVIIDLLTNTNEDNVKLYLDQSNSAADLFVVEGQTASVNTSLKIIAQTGEISYLELANGTNLAQIYMHNASDLYIRNREDSQQIIFGVTDAVSANVNALVLDENGGTFAVPVVTSGDVDVQGGDLTNSTGGLTLNANSGSSAVTLSCANFLTAAPMLNSVGTASGVVAYRLGQTVTEGLELTVLDEDVYTDGDTVFENLTTPVPDGSVIISVQANIDTLVVGNDDNDDGLVAVGIGTAGDPDKYGETTNLTQNQKMDTMVDWTVLSGAEQLRVNATDGAGNAVTETMDSGVVRVRVVYWTLNSLDNT